MPRSQSLQAFQAKMTRRAELLTAICAQAETVVTTWSMLYEPDDHPHMTRQILALAKLLQDYRETT